MTFLSKWKCASREIKKNDSATLPTFFFLPFFSLLLSFASTNFFPRNLSSSIALVVLPLGREAEVAKEGKRRGKLAEGGGGKKVAREG